MDDYAKARYKDTKELTILKFIDDNGKMNPDISKVDFIQDGDLNKSLQHFVSGHDKIGCRSFYKLNIFAVLGDYGR